jgi:hypothetical protein
MDTSLVDLARDPTFIPLLHNYCDNRCAQCRLTRRCLLLAAHARAACQRSSDDGAPPSPQAQGLAVARAILDAAVPGTEAIAAISVKLADPEAPPDSVARGHPLEFLARHYARQAGSYLASLPGRSAEGWPPDSPVGVVAWFHGLIAAKTYRALVSEHGAAGSPQLLFDALGSAKLVLVAVDRSVSALEAIAGIDADARVSGLVELLGALRTALEIRFPAAKAFVRPGLDEAFAETPGEVLNRPDSDA